MIGTNIVILLTHLVCGLSPLWQQQPVPSGPHDPWLVDLVMRGLVVLASAFVGIAMFLAKSAMQSFRQLNKEFQEMRLQTDQAISELHRKTEVEIAEIRRRMEHEIATLRLETERRLGRIERRVHVEHEEDAKT